MAAEVGQGVRAAAEDGEHEAPAVAVAAELREHDAVRRREALVRRRHAAQRRPDAGALELAHLVQVELAEAGVPGQLAAELPGARGERVAAVEQREHLRDGVLGRQRRGVRGRGSRRGAAPSAGFAGSASSARSAPASRARSASSSSPAGGRLSVTCTTPSSRSSLERRVAVVP